MPRHFPNWIKGYLEYTKNLEAPAHMHVWAAISAIAGALRRKVWIDQDLFQWTPNFYIVLVAPPGIVSKSTTLDVAMRLLKKVPGVRFGPQAVTWQALTQAFADATELVQIDAETFFPCSCLTIVSSEFGSFLDPKDRQMIDVLVDLWDGKLDTWRKVTKTQGSDVIQNPWINLGACTTPAWIAGNFPEYLIGGGFCSRTVFVYADAKRHLNAYPGRRRDKSKTKELEEKLIADLEQIGELKGEYVLTAECMDWGEAWYAEHNAKVPRELASDRFGGYRARKQGLIHKLAMVLTAAESDELVITKETLEKAVNVSNAIEADMPKVFSWIGRGEEVQLATEIVNLVNARGGMDRADLFRMVFRSCTYKSFNEALESAIAAGMLHEGSEGNRVLILPAHTGAQPPDRVYNKTSGLEDPVETTPDASPAAVDSGEDSPR